MASDSQMFFLVSVQNHQNRIWGPNGERFRCEFPSHQWFVELVKKHDLDCWLGRKQNAATRFFVLALMLCRPGIASHDLFSMYEHRDELDIWREFWTGMGNMFTICVEECFVLDQALEIFTCRDARYEQPRPLSGRRHPLSPFLPTIGPAEDMLGVTGNLWQKGRQVLSCVASDVLARWSMSLTDCVLAVPVLEPVVSLIAKGSWASVGLLGHWFLPEYVPELFDNIDFPPAELCEKTFAPRDQQHWSAILSPDKVNSLMQRVRAWAPVLFRSAGDEEESNSLKLELADMLQTLDVVRQQTAIQSRPKSYPGHVLIASVFLSFLLESRKHMAQVIPLALRVALPGLDVGALLSHVQAPRTTTLARAATYLDFAFIQLCKMKWEEKDHVFHMWADSSPQSGRDWLMIMQALCRKEDLVEVMLAVNALTRCRPDLSDHMDAEEPDLEVLVQQNHCVRTKLLHHRCIPVAMASGHTALHDKASCLLHAMALECRNLAALPGHMACVKSWTSDFGAEVQVPAFASLDLKALIPPWLHSQTLLESDVHEDDQAPREMLQPCSDPTQLMPGCLIVPGILHIVHNLSADLHEKLSWWEPFLGSFEGCGASSWRKTLTWKVCSNLCKEYPFGRFRR